ncbi:MAG: hypothetical protein GW762_00770 [Candidatus Pacebacteria bacterium]|nr:hypothetical protein [Candidatus Paceibacterota bacterium]PIR63299.1 MAG: hypothetical protein COU64_05410 [Candidatus Pacebacteria bacterium CG10_big_fil_rev_8_21_14_0_10_40_26]PIZ79180.1 MAG: hypothetical protein COY01_02000 [Candidatus Pacebacteria bacterium CG_4_10_14_0_2_um_filter_40_20]PJA68835.1 MAG: hypothetical protein CO156_02605 [Candidatus Pacebacteria bacterium CG_4_9_14_3_um_filter_40_12]PJC42146.1 MAG: hypothetical protein CO041_00710 [Candidatus Pacebacteria bacterium CG_4_9_
MKVAVRVSFILIFLLSTVGSVFADTPAGARLSHICDTDGQPPLVAEIVMPNAPQIAENAVGEMEISFSGTTQTVVVNWDRWTGPTAHFTATLPITITVPYMVTSGWVIDAAYPIENLPQQVTSSNGEWQCAPTAVSLGTVSAQQSGQSIHLGVVIGSLVVLMAISFALSPWGRRFINDRRKKSSTPTG